jgi:lysozyme
VACNTDPVAIRPRHLIAAALGLLAALLLLAALGASAAEARVRGIDVSRFQGEIDWPRVGKTKVAFAFVQASRGSGRDCKVVPQRCGPDEWYVANYEGAREAGLAVGAYHRAFASGRTRKRARKDARKEARVFARQVGALQPGDLRPVLDVEAPFSKLNARRLRLWIHTWLKKVRRKLGSKPIIYTNYSSWQATGDTTRFASHGYPLWVANFGVRSPLVPAGNWAGQGWAVWQFTSTGTVKGIKGPVDKDKLRGGLGEITAR